LERNFRFVDLARSPAASRMRATWKRRATAYESLLSDSFCRLMLGVLGKRPFDIASFSPI
jgi:hypothetical protein